MRRIYFLVPDSATAHKIVNALRTENIPDRHIHVLAKRGTSLEAMPEAGVFEKTDFLPALERGAALGGATGLLFGLAALRFAGFVIAGGPILGVLLTGATIGSLMGGLAGLQMGNSRLKQFEEAIEQGEILILVDVPKERIDDISKIIVKHHPGTKFEGIEPLLPPSY
ncbi:MAG: DUF1269 domain-containing protein [Gammaproteobacteria bacterium]